MLFLYKVRENLLTVMISAFPNPVVLLGSTVVLVGSLTYGVRRGLPLAKLEGTRHALRRAADHPVAMPILGFFSSWLPFVPVKRVMFLYHYMPAYAFGMMVVAWAMGQLWNRSRAWCLVLVGAMVFTLFWTLPATVGYFELYKGVMEKRVVIPRWIW